MRKVKTTKKCLKEMYHIINAGNGNLQNLLKEHSSTYYCTRAEGWACDAYIIGNYAILDGYDCTGKLVSREIMRKYDNRARELWNKYKYGNSKYYTYTRVCNLCNKLLDEFIREVS